MDKAFYDKDMKSFECSSPSELERGFCEEHSLLSALQQDHLSSSRVSNESMVNNGCDTRLSLLSSLSTSMDPLTPSQVSFVSSINEPDTEGCYLSVPLQGKSSTPQLTIAKQGTAASCNRSHAVLQGSLCDVSLIKSESPKAAMDLSALEYALSPKPTSSSQAHAGLTP